MVFVDGLVLILLLLWNYLCFSSVYLLVCFETLRVESRTFHSVDSTLPFCYKPLKKGFFFFYGFMTSLRSCLQTLGNVEEFSILHSCLHCAVWSAVCKGFCLFVFLHFIRKPSGSYIWNNFLEVSWTSFITQSTVCLWIYGCVSQRWAASRFVYSLPPFFLFFFLLVPLPITSLCTSIVSLFTLVSPLLPGFSLPSLLSLSQAFCFCACPWCWMLNKAF